AVAASQTATGAPGQAVTTCLPLEEKPACTNGAWWNDSAPNPSRLSGPVGANVASCFCVAVSHSRAVPSPDAVTICLPSGEKATAHTVTTWPAGGKSCLPVAVSQTLTAVGP